MRVLTCALLCLVVLTGCGNNAVPAADGSGNNTVPAANGSGTSADKLRERENVIATCMKKKGFGYVPTVSRPKRSDAGTADYAAMKEDRGKYGFGIFSAFVYPEQAPTPEPDPNEATINSLSGAKRQAYLKTMNECRVTALQQVDGLKVTSLDDYQEQMSKEIERIDKELDGDPKLVELAGSFAECLKSKGEQVTSSRPNRLSGRGMTVWGEEAKRLGKKGTVTAEAARPYLAREIKSALVDLECGKDFYAAYIPLGTRLTNEARVRFGFTEQ
ncbi:hypothetical protein [Streptosporangium sp. NPDC051022]|uniref:hypothetical protein n=1 Tax=Streptosporangium sp. NPDC051022 TaxID=3155752 RepID=UPI0034401592